MRYLGCATAMLLLALTSPASASQEDAAAFIRYMLERTASAEHPCVLTLEGSGPSTVFVCARASLSYGKFQETWDREAVVEGVNAQPLADWTQAGSSRMRWYQVVDRWVVVTYHKSEKEIVLSYPRDRAGVAFIAAGIEPPRRVPSGPATAPASRAARPGSAGTVVLSAVVREDGSVGDPEVLGCVPRGKGLEKAAMQAISAWAYEPATREGVPVSVAMTATITYGPGGDLSIQSSSPAAGSDRGSPGGGMGGLP